MVVSLTNSQGRAYGIVRNGLIMIAPAYDSANGTSQSASSLSIWVVTAWHRNVGELKNVAGFGRRIELGPWWMAPVEVPWVQTEFVADSG